MWPVTQNLIGRGNNLSFETWWTSQWRREFLLRQKKINSREWHIPYLFFFLFSNLLLLCTFYLLSLCLKIYINAKWEHLVVVWDLFSYRLLSINQKALVLYFINERKFLEISTQTQTRRLEWREKLIERKLSQSSRWLQAFNLRNCSF